jgi:hypothetical protein
MGSGSEGVSRTRCAFFMPLRRAGTVPNTGVRYGPGSAAHHHSASKTRVNALMVKNGALRCVRGTGSYPALDNWLGAGIATIGGLALRPSTWKPATRL